MYAIFDNITYEYLRKNGEWIWCDTEEPMGYGFYQDLELFLSDKQALEKIAKLRVEFLEFNPESEIDFTLHWFEEEVTYMIRAVENEQLLAAIKKANNDNT